MTLQMYVLASVIILLGATTIEYSQRNTSCFDIKNGDGFNFAHECPAGSEISAFYNKTPIAIAKPGKIPVYLDEVKSMDNYSVVTRDCRDLEVKCFISMGRLVKENWVFFKITEEIKDPEPNLPWSLTGVIVIGIIGIIVIIVIIGIIVLVWCYITWKKDMKAQHRSSTLTSCCLRKGNSEAELTDTAETILVDIPPATDLQGSGGNDPEQDDTLKTVHVHSVNPKTDCNSPYTNGLDHNLNNGSTENGDIKAPDVDRAMNRDLRDDPGGRDVVAVTDMHSGCVCDDFGDCGREDHEAEGELLLPNERANIQGPDMTGGAEAFVNKCGFDPDQVSRCFAAPNTDVESTPKMKNVI